MEVPQVNSKKYDLEERTFEFARRCRDFSKSLPRTLENIEYRSQLVRSSGSTAANYIEANEALSKRDYGHRVKICRKEAKESRLWLRLCDIGKKGELEGENLSLIKEAMELCRIFGSILEKL